MKPELLLGHHLLFKYLFNLINLISACFKMGASCETCHSGNDEALETIETTKKYHLLPSEFYNQKTK